MFDRIHGDHPIHGWHITMIEDKTLSHPFLGYWARGVDYGYCTPNSLDISGTGRDTAGNSYDWDFHHQSKTPVLPAN